MIQRVTFYLLFLFMFLSLPGSLFAQETKELTLRRIELEGGNRLGTQSFLLIEFNSSYAKPSGKIFFNIYALEGDKKTLSLSGEKDISKEGGAVGANEVYRINHPFVLDEASLSLVGAAKIRVEIKHGSLIETVEIENSKKGESIGFVYGASSNEDFTKDDFWEEHKQVFAKIYQVPARTASAMLTLGDNLYSEDAILALFLASKMPQSDGPEMALELSKKLAAGANWMSIFEEFAVTPASLFPEAGLTYRDINATVGEPSFPIKQAYFYAYKNQDIPNENLRSLAVLDLLLRIKGVNGKSGVRSFINSGDVTLAQAKKLLKNL